MNEVRSTIEGNPTMGAVRKMHECKEVNGTDGDRVTVNVHPCSESRTYRYIIVEWSIDSMPTDFVESLSRFIASASCITLFVLIKMFAIDTDILNGGKKVIYIDEWNINSKVTKGEKLKIHRFREICKYRSLRVVVV